MINTNDEDEIMDIINEELYKYEEDDTNRIGMLMDLEDSENLKEAAEELLKYLNNPNTSKTRNDIIEEIERIVEETH